MPSDTPEQIVAKVELYAEAEEAVAKLKAAGDVLVALELKRLKGSAYEAERDAAADQMMAYWQQGAEQLRSYADELLSGRRTLHWPFVFPEIIERGGFDGFIGNPPFLGGTVASTILGTDYTGLLKQLNEPWHGKSDLVPVIGAPTRILFSLRRIKRRS